MERWQGEVEVDFDAVLMPSSKKTKRLLLLRERLVKAIKRMENANASGVQHDHACRDQMTIATA